MTNEVEKCQKRVDECEKNLVDYQNSVDSFSDFLHKVMAEQSRRRADDWVDAMRKFFAAYKAELIEETGKADPAGVKVNEELLEAAKIMVGNRGHYAYCPVAHGKPDHCVCGYGPLKDAVVRAEAEGVNTT